MESKDKGPAHAGPLSIGGPACEVGLNRGGNWDTVRAGGGGVSCLGAGYATVMMQVVLQVVV